MLNKIHLLLVFALFEPTLILGSYDSDESRNGYMEEPIEEYSSVEKDLGFGRNVQSVADCSLAKFEEKLEIVEALDCYRGYKATWPLPEYFIKCKPKLDYELQQAVDQIPAQAKEKFELLSRGLQNVDIDLISKSEYNKRLAGGMIELLNREGEQSLDKETLLEPSKGKDYLAERTRSVLEGFCRGIYEPLKETLEIYDILAKSKKTIKDVNPLAKKWLVKGKICRTMLEDDKVKNQVDSIVYGNLRKKTYLEENKPETSTFNEWEDLKTKTYNSRGWSIEPTDFLGYLKRMGDIFPQLEKEGLIDHADRSVWNEVKQLIEFSEISESKCNVRTFRELKSAEATYEKHAVNFSVFLRHFAWKQFSLCLPNLSDQLDEAVKHLTGYMKTEVEQLIQAIKNVGDAPHSPLYSQNHKGILEFLKSKPRVKLNKRTPINEIDQLIERSIDSFCQPITRELARPMELYDRLSYAEDFAKNIGQVATDWLEKYRICVKISRERKAVLRGIHELLVGPSGNGGTRKKFFGVF